MTLPALAPVSALELRLGVPTGSLAGADLARAQACLGDVSALVRDVAGRDWVDTDGVTITAPASALVVVLQAARRGFNNPDGYLGEAVEGYSWQADPSNGTSVYLTDAERRTVRRAARGRSSVGAVDVRTPSAYGDEAYGLAVDDLDPWGGCLP